MTDFTPLIANPKYFLIGAGAQFGVFVAFSAAFMTGLYTIGQAASIGIIGGADGPTTMIVAAQVGANWLNVLGLVQVVLILIPNIIYALKFKNQKNACTNKVMNLMEQIGRYTCMIFMIINVGLTEFGFGGIRLFLIYFLGNIVLLLAYWLIWVLYFIKQTPWKSMALAVLPVCIFLICGISLQHWLLVISAVIFGVGHIYVTRKNIA